MITSTMPHFSTRNQLKLALIVVAIFICLNSSGQFIVTYMNDKAQVATIRSAVYKSTTSSYTDAETESTLSSTVINRASVGQNSHNFSYLLNEPTICSAQRSNLFTITFVHSAPGNYKRRILIRETWGNPKFYSQVGNVVLFALGVSKDPKIQMSINHESDRFHDVIQENFIDSYRNLTFKAILWLKWVTFYCPQAKYIVKVDDDIFVNPFHLANHLKSLYVREIASKRSILCLSWDGMPVMRNKTNKWYVSPEDYPNDYFSIYCSGSAYMITNDLIQPMYNKSLTTKFFWVDDFYTTGLLPKGLNVTYHSLRSLYVLKPTELQNRLVNGYGIFGHVQALATRYKMWKQILKQRNLQT